MSSPTEATSESCRGIAPTQYFWDLPITKVIYKSLTSPIVAYCGLLESPFDVVTKRQGPRANDMHYLGVGNRLDRHTLQKYIMATKAWVLERMIVYANDLLSTRSFDYSGGVCLLIGNKSKTLHECYYLTSRIVLKVRSLVITSSLVFVILRGATPGDRFQL